MNKNNSFAGFSPFPPISPIAPRNRRIVRAHPKRMSYMPDQPKHRAPADPSQINLNEPWEVTYRRKEYGCTEQQLRQAVAAVGTSAAKVSQYLKNKSTPPTGKAQRFK